MTKEKLQEILANPIIDEVIDALQVSSFLVPKWTDLQPQFDPLEHTIWDVNVYPQKLDDNQQDDFKRTALALQKLAVSRIAQAMFATPTERIYNYDKNSETLKKAVDILEQVYRVNNYIDSTNLERGKQVNAACEAITIWKVYDKENLVEGEKVTQKLTHSVYSAMNGYEIFANQDENQELLVVSIGYKDVDDVEFLDVYINLDRVEFRRYVKLDEWVLAEGFPRALEVFPVVHIWMPEPVWGGEAGTNLVEQLEEMESYQGLYIKRNALPTFTIDYGDITGGNASSTTESSNDSRRIIELGKGGQMNDVTWEGADKAITSRYQRIRNAFFEQVQMPDISFANMINSNTSAENKELLFSDAKAKARDLGGEWEKMFFQELEIVKKFIAIIFGKESELEQITIRSQIRPYSIKSKKETAEYIALAEGAMSLNTKVSTLGEVDDINQEVETIEQENAAQAN